MPPSTPNRNTRLDFGRHRYAIYQPYFLFDRDASQINQSVDERVTNAHFVTGIGYRLRSYQMRAHNAFETNNQPGRPAHSVPAGFSLIAHHRDEPLSGVTYLGTPASGGLLYQKQVAAGGSWEDRLSADQTSYPGPTLTSAVTLDRVYASNDVHDPQDGLVFEFVNPGSRVRLLGPIASVYFNGPAGTDDRLSGFGQYCLVIELSGECSLYERGDSGGSTVWKLRGQFGIPLGPFDSLTTLVITTNATPACSGLWRGNRIVFKQSSALDLRSKSKGFTAQLEGNLLTAAATAIGNAIEPFVYTVPRASIEPIQQTAIRLDLRRDVRALLNVGTLTYPTTGEIIDEPVAFPTVATDAQPFTFEWYGDRPTGTTITAKLFDHETDTELTGTTTIDDCIGQQIVFDVPTGTQIRYLRAEFELTGDGTKTPTLTGYRIIRQPVTSEDIEDAAITVPIRAAGTAIPSVPVESVDISGTGEDPAEESASFVVSDLLTEGSALYGYSGKPVDAVITDDLGAVTSIIHTGYVKSSSSVRVAPSTDDEARRYTIASSGMYERLRRAISPTRLNLLDKNAGISLDDAAPQKATDALRLLFTACGYPSAALDIPDLPIRLFGYDQNAVIEPSTPLYEPIMQIVRDYLGGYVIWDPNAGDAGMWRVVARKNAPYGYLARFTPNHPGNLKLPHLPESYGTEGTHSYASGQEVPVLPMLRGIEDQWEPAEANCVIVNGTTLNPSAFPGNTKGMQHAFAINFESVNALGLGFGDPLLPDPTDPDTLGELVCINVWDPTLTTPEAAKWVARRVFDAACYARHYLRFRSFLPLVTDITDTHQTYARPLRFYDMVEVWDNREDAWVPYVVIKCSPRYKKSGFMYADYVLMSTTPITQFAQGTGPIDPFRIEQRYRKGAARRSMGHPAHSAMVFSSQRQISFSLGAASTLPVQTSAALQVLDPTDPNFGTFLTLPGYDPAP